LPAAVSRQPAEAAEQLAAHEPDLAVAADNDRLTRADDRLRIAAAPPERRPPDPRSGA
jgi:hypothetical protein